MRLAHFGAGLSLILVAAAHRLELLGGALNDLLLDLGDRLGAPAPSATADCAGLNSRYRGASRPGAWTTTSRPR
jgi:hypothetical protein